MPRWGAIRWPVAGETADAGPLPGGREPLDLGVAPEGGSSEVRGRPHDCGAGGMSASIPPRGRAELPTGPGVAPYSSKIATRPLRSRSRAWARSQSPSPW
jgi:hypothetical protein